MVITKKILLGKLSSMTGLPQTKCNDVLGAFEEVVGLELAEGNKVRLAGFGSFYTRAWGGYESRQTGRYIPYQRVIRFKPGSRLKRAVKSYQEENPTLHEKP